MIWRMLFPALLKTGPAYREVVAIRDSLVNFYVVKGTAGLVCIDSGWRPGHIISAFGELGLSVRDVVAVFLTHSHWDHARGLAAFPNAEVFVGEQEGPHLSPRFSIQSRKLERVRDGQELERGGITVRVVSTPGHTPGAVSYLVGGRLLFTGDTLRLRHGEILPFLAWFNHDGQAQIGSIRKLAGIEQLECVLTGHTGLTVTPAKAFQRWRGQEARS
jgi:glyoxylase-like metal-dependent hydrolase (beta-lactamase superfamily II)